jgi:hypothetical protein
MEFLADFMETNSHILGDEVILIINSLVERIIIQIKYNKPPLGDLSPQKFINKCLKILK